MLVKFKVKNFLSFKSKAVLNTMATNITELRESNIFVNNKTKYLKSLAIYGPNASGKSNFFKALSFFRHFVFNSYKLALDESIAPVVPFKFSSETETQPSEFEIIYVYKNVRYRYGFIVDRNRIYREWLYSHDLESKSREKLLFERNKNMKFGSALTRWKIKKVTETDIRSNVLLLTKLAMDNDRIKEEIFDWFKNLNIISGYDRSYAGYIRRNFEKYKDNILPLFHSADIPIDDIILEKRRLEPQEILKIPEPLRSELTDQQQIVEKVTLLTKHKKYDRKNHPTGSALLNLEAEESRGTNQLFNLLGPIIDSINNGKVLLVDELDSSLHPLLVQFIVRLFNSPENKNSQLIFTTHDVTLLDAHCLRRDQIWFTELDKYGSSNLFSLSDYKEIETGRKIRKDADYLNQYLLGRYGAVPLIDEETAVLNKEK